MIAEREEYIMIYPSIDQARALAQGHTVVPIAMELFSDLKTPIELLRTIAGSSKQFYILESVAGDEVWGRYSFLGYDPTITISGKNGKVTVRNGKTTELCDKTPQTVLRELLAQYKSPRIESLPPFTGGLVGYFAYEFIRYIEPTLNLQAEDSQNFDDFYLMLMDKVIAFDHYKQKIYLIVNIATEYLEDNYIHGVTQLKDMERMILQAMPPQAPTEVSCGSFTPQHTEAAFCGMVERAKEYIREGEAFQVVLSNRMSAPFQGKLLDTYRVLRTVNPSPYMVYFHGGDLEIACASPETLISLKNGTLSTFPLAGTCPRGKTKAEDEKLCQALLKNPKELAEHNMLVDLGRNDLGKVSAFGTVEVAEYCKIKQFSHVSHIASRVEGELAQGKDAMDAVCATLPAGTLSGAPKKRACEIIDELEGVSRGGYGGAIGYLDFAGNLDLCIAIRMAVRKGGTVHVQSGAGIVADSDPQAEYQEIMNKAGAVMAALGYGKGE